MQGDKVYYKRENEKRWLRPAKVIGIDGNTVILKHGGILREVANTEKEGELSDDEKGV